MAIPTNCQQITTLQKNTLAEARTRRHFEQAHFAVYDEAFLDIIGTEPDIRCTLERDWPAFHEAGVFIPEQDAVYVTSNHIEASTGKAIKISKLGRRNDGEWNFEVIEPDVMMGNGGINYHGGVLFCEQGYDRQTDGKQTAIEESRPSGLVLMEAKPPYNTEVLLSSYHWRAFTSVNDVVVHTDGSIWFTDPIYGHEQGFRNAPELPCQVYRFEPESGQVRVVADGFGRPNGLCFSPDEKTMYVTDTDWIHGDGTTDLQRPSTIYAFDVIERHGAQFLANRRVFAMADEGIPDGIKCDLDGNVYSGCGDGVSVWSAGAKLLGKIKVPGGVANFCFGNKGELFLLNETKFWVVKISKKVQGALLHNLGIHVQ